MHNSDVDWSTFSSTAYLEHNYARLRADDALIVGRLAQFYSALPHGLRVLEVGTGPNMYPVLAALPVAERIDVVEHAPTNVAWLRDEVKQLSEVWRPFWQALQKASPLYAHVDPARAVRDLVRVEQASIFDLAEEQWDVVSMHFVAESITSDSAEFDKAMQKFLCAVRHGGSFVAALMEGSRGYAVLDAEFPALAVDEAVVRAALPGAVDVEVLRIGLEADEEELRTGYSGMLVVTGRRA